MSIRKKPEEAVPVLLARLHKAKEYTLQGRRAEDPTDIDADSLSSKFDGIEQELIGMKDVFPRIKRWENSVVGQFCVLEGALDEDDIFKNPDMETQVHQKLDIIKNDLMQLKDLISKVDMRVTSRMRTMTFKPMDHALEDDNDDLHRQTVASKEWVDHGINDKISTSQGMSSLSASFHCLEGAAQVKMCLLCLSVFPENSVIRKKPVIYWWMGEGIVKKNKNQTAEEVGEEVFQQLLNEGFIKPMSSSSHHDNNDMKSSRPPSVNSFVVYPWIRRILILAANENGFLKFDSLRTPCNGERRAFLWRGGNDDGNDIMSSNGEREEDLLTVFNVEEKYLGTRPERLIAKLRKVEVLQLGRWQNCVTHHIEVENQALLNGLGSQKHLKYLSLRGISRIQTLPHSVVKLISLEILDLRACHNLEKLPSGMSALKNLTHLDVSECYLLESMPKGLEHLLALQVLKGFVIGKNNACKISDLARLKYLRKFSVRVGNLPNESQEEGQLYSLRNFSALRILTISWGSINSSSESQHGHLNDMMTLPPSLTKLDLRCSPLVEVPEWLWPRRLPNLEKLYINGGKLSSLDHQDDSQIHWKVKFLRLKYLNNLRIDQEKLLLLFPDLRCLEKISCHKHYPDIKFNRNNPL